MFYSEHKHATAVWILDLDLKPLDQPINNIPLHCIRRCGALVSPYAICSCLFEDKNPADRESEANQAFVFRAGSQVEGIGAEVSAAASSSKPVRRRSASHEAPSIPLVFPGQQGFVFVFDFFVVNNCGRLSSSWSLLVNTKTPPRKIFSQATEAEKKMLIVTVIKF